MLTPPSPLLDRKVMGARLSPDASKSVSVTSSRSVIKLHSESRCEAKPVRKGILKPRSAAAPRPRRGACARRRRHFRALSCGARAVTWQRDVRVQVYSRLLGGGCGVPADGTIVSLGLGTPSRRVFERLAGDRQADKRPIEETRWVTEPQRMKLLRGAMGEARFFRAMRPFRHETRQLLAAREASKRDEKDQLFMPRSFDEARERARVVQEEAAEILMVFQDARVNARLAQRNEAVCSPAHRPSLAEVDRMLWGLRTAPRSPATHPPVRRLQLEAAYGSSIQWCASASAAVGWSEQACVPYPHLGTCC